MTLVKSIAITWIGTCIFMILLALKLDSKGEYSWFVTFIPRFFVCLIDIIWILFRIVNHIRTGRDNQKISLKRKSWYIAATLLEVVFEILLCLRLDGLIKISLYFAFIPLWIILTGQMVIFFYFQISVVRS